MVFKRMKNASFIKVVILILVSFIATSLLIGCEKEVKVTEVTVDKPSVNLVVGDTETVVASVEPEDATNTDVVWTTNNADVATVENGVITAVAPGQASIIATVGNKTATVSVTVTLKTFTVTFEVDGGSSITALTVNEGAKASQPATPTKTGHDFVGWFANAALTTEFDFDTEINENTTVYAKWEAQDYTITFFLDGGSAVAPQEITYGDKVTLPEVPTKEGYDFVGWFTTFAFAEEFDFDTLVEEDTMLYAKWQIRSYTVTFIENDGTLVDPQTVEHGRRATTPTTTKEDYLFVGWFLDEDFTEEFAFTTNITSDITLYAQWELDVYRVIEFELNEGSWNITNIDGLITIDPLASHALSFYNSGYWGNAGTSIFLYDNATLDPLYAHRVGLNVNDKGFYEVTDVIATGDGNLSRFDYVIICHSGYEAGYEFILTIGIGDIITLTGFDITTATAGAISGTINVYPANTGTSTEQVTYEIGMELPTPYRDRAIFEGWYLTSDFQGEPVTEVTEDAKVYAKWYDLSNYGYINFDLDGGLWTLDQLNVFFGDVISTNSLAAYNAILDEYLAIHETAVLLVDSDSTFKPNNSVERVGLNLRSDGMFEVVEKLAANGPQMDIELYDYVLFAHSANSVGFGFLVDLEVGQLIVLEGVDLDGEFGEVEGTISVFAKTSQSLAPALLENGTELPTPTKDGFEFGGWFDNADFEGDAITEVDGDATLYAMWTELVD